MSPWWHVESAEIGRRRSGSVLIAPRPPLFSFGLCHPPRYQPDSRWFTTTKAKKWAGIIPGLRMRREREPYSMWALRDRGSEMNWLCPMRSCYVTLDRDKLQTEDKAYPLVTKKGELGWGKRTWLKHWHQQFASSSLTGSWLEADRGRQLLLGTFSMQRENGLEEKKKKVLGYLMGCNPPQKKKNGVRVTTQERRQTSGTKPCRGLPLAKRVGRGH